MLTTMRTLVRGGRIVTAQQDFVGDILMEDEKVAAIGFLEDIRTDLVVSATGKLVFPGAVDVHTHMDMTFQGALAADDFRSGSIAAAMGGTTTIIDFPIQQRGDAQELASPEGFVNSQLYANVVPILLFIFTIGMGTSALAGEEDRRTMDLLLAQPVTRDRVGLHNFAAIATLSGIITASILLVLLVANTPAGLDMSLVGMIAANVGAWILGLTFGALALAISAVTGKRGLTLGASAGIAVATFFLYGLAPLVEALEPAQKLSPFWWYLGAKPLNNGFDVMFLWMVVWIVVAVAVAIWGFRRRDVSV